MAHEINRRSFLKVSAGAACLSVLGLPEPAFAAGEGTLATMIDLSLCDGCAGKTTPACVSACKTLNAHKIPAIHEPIPIPWPRKTIEDWSKKKEVSDRLTPYNFIYVQKVVVTEGGRPKTVFIPRRCMHCDNPACATICPFSANHKHKNGAVVIDQDTCFGGAKCKTVCPWAIPQRQSGVGIYLHVLPSLMGNGVMYKCDLCNGLLVQGKKPACIEACPAKAMVIGPRKDIFAVADERAKQLGGHIYGRKENGGTATVYVSPVSFEALNRVMEKKPGQPTMGPVMRRMEKTDTLGKAVLAAPVIGLLAGAAGAMKLLARNDAKTEGGD